jgi:ketosteroid isomerase-like protein
MFEGPNSADNLRMSDQDAIRKLEDRRYQAMCEGDIATLEKLLADSLVYTHSYGGADSKASYLAGVRSKRWQYRKVERPVEDIQVFGDCALVTGHVRIDLIADGAPKMLESRFTNVWIRRGGAWQMVAWQSTPTPK